MKPAIRNTWRFRDAAVFPQRGSYPVVTEQLKLS